MKKERIRKPDGRYLIYYSFDEGEIVSSDARPSARSGRLQAGKLGPRKRAGLKAAATKAGTKGKC